MFAGALENTAIASATTPSGERARAQSVLTLPFTGAAPEAPAALPEVPVTG